MGLCNDYGISKLLLCPLEVLPAGIHEHFLLQWNCFEKTIVGKTGAGEPKKRRGLGKFTSTQVFQNFWTT
jgi:hypothetical protein